MVRKGIFIVLLLICAGCGYEIEWSGKGIYRKYSLVYFTRAEAEARADELYAEDVKVYEAKRQAEKEAAQSGLAKYEEEEAKRLTQLKRDFSKELADTSCLKDKWSRYEFGGYFQRVAKQYGMTPYDVVWGSDYSKRNIPKLLLLEILNNSLSYTYHFSEAEYAAYRGNEKEVFNKIVRKDNNCHLKLK